MWCFNRLSSAYEHMTHDAKTKDMIRSECRVMTYTCSVCRERLPWMMWTTLTCIPFVLTRPFIKAVFVPFSHLTCKSKKRRYAKRCYKSCYRRIRWFWRKRASWVIWNTMTWKESLFVIHLSQLYSRHSCISCAIVRTRFDEGMVCC